MGTVPRRHLEQTDVIEPMAAYFLDEPKGSALVYVKFIWQAEALKRTLEADLHAAIRACHAAAGHQEPSMADLPRIGLYTAKHSSEHRELTADAFANDETRVMIATLAFSVVRCARVGSDGCCLSALFFIFIFIFFFFPLSKRPSQFIRCRIQLLHRASTSVPLVSSFSSSCPAPRRSCCRTSGAVVAAASTVCALCTLPCRTSSFASPSRARQMPRRRRWRRPRRPPRRSSLRRRAPRRSVRRTSTRVSQPLSLWNLVIAFIRHHHTRAIVPALCIFDIVVV